MLGLTEQRREETESEATIVVPEEREAAETAETGGTDSAAFRLARLLYGSVLAFMAVDNLRNLEERIGYAESKGAPMPEYSVPAISGALLGGGVGIALWRLPRLAAVGVATFLVSITPVMHDFWNLEGDERSSQQIHFLKNSALLGGALSFFAAARRSE